MLSRVFDPAILVKHLLSNIHIPLLNQSMELDVEQEFNLQQCKAKAYIHYILSELITMAKIT